MLSPSTEYFGVNDKREAYLALPTLRVLLASPTTVRVERHARGHERDGWTVETFRDIEATTDLAPLEGSLALADPYRRPEARMDPSLRIVADSGDDWTSRTAQEKSRSEVALEPAEVG